MRQEAAQPVRQEAAQPMQPMRQEQPQPVQHPVQPGLNATGLSEGQPMQPMRQEQPQSVRQEAAQPMQPMRQEAAQPMQPGLGVAESMLAGAGNVFTSPLGTSNIGKLFGSQKTMPPPAQPAAAEQSSIKSEDLPKPR
jgi:hypothetical protein